MVDDFEFGFGSLGGTALVNKRKTYEEVSGYKVPLCNDLLFAEVCKTSEFMPALLSEVLGEEVSYVEDVSSQNTIPNFQSSEGEVKSVRLDVFMKADGRVVNVEIQNRSHEHMARRVRYYSSAIDIQYFPNAASMDYNLPDTYVVVFYNTSISGTAKFLERYRTVSDDGNVLDDGRHIVFVDYRQRCGDESTYLGAVCSLLRDEVDTSNIKHMEVVSAMNDIMANEIERRNIEKYNENMRAERANGRDEERVRVVLNMFSNGICPREISRMTGISIEFVNEVLETYRGQLP